MDESQQALVRATFAKIAPISDVAAAMFYEKLFTIDPDLRPLFRNDMQRQGAMLMAVIATAVANLHRLDQLMPTVRELGRRHAGYGVGDRDYDTVAIALLATLEATLGEEFTEDVRGAWTACYLALAGEMKAAAAAAKKHGDLIASDESRPPTPAVGAGIGSQAP
jgi:hemoglobin-like flavoprotein